MKNPKEEIVKVDKIIEKGSYSLSWKSLEGYKVPKWYKDAKFGIFIHWGVYSVPAFGNEWNPRNMYKKNTPDFKNHIDNWGKHSKFGYKDFIPMFKAEKFDPDKWCKLFSDSGAKYIVPVAEHHDGFAMYDCGYSRWDSTKMGPKIDIMENLSKSAKKYGLVFGLSSHRAEHWFFMNGGMEFDSDIKTKKWHDFYGPAQPDGSDPDDKFLTDWLLRTCELVDKYQPSVIWFDWWIQTPVFQPYLKKLLTYYYNKANNWENGPVINYKYDTLPEEAAVLDVERGQLSNSRSLVWQTDTSVSNNSWGYIKNHDYKDPGDIIRDFVDIISKNGVLLLNIGPKPDGEIPEPEQKILLEIGKWLKLNGEAVYESRPWRISGEGPTQVIDGAFSDKKRVRFTDKDIRFTRNENTIYAFLLGWPKSRKCRIKSLGLNSHNRPAKISRIKLLGNGSNLKWKQGKEYLEVNLPLNKPGNHAFVLKIV